MEGSRVDEGYSKRLGSGIYRRMAFPPHRQDDATMKALNHRMGAARSPQEGRRVGREPDRQWTRRHHRGTEPIDDAVTEYGSVAEYAALGDRFHIAVRWCTVRPVDQP